MFDFEINFEYNKDFLKHTYKAYSRRYSVFMIVAFCILVPSIFLMFFRNKILGRKIECAFDKDVLSFIKEYLLTLFLLNFITIFIMYKVFHHTGDFTNAFNQYTEFTFHYLVITMVL